MTPETTLAAKLRDLQLLMQKEEKLTDKHRREVQEVEKRSEQEQTRIRNRYDPKINELKKTPPVAPLKKQIKSTTPSITVTGIGVAIALILSIVMLIVSISVFVKIRKINNVIEEPGEAYAEWCESLSVKGDFNDMTEKEWEPVQKEWSENGVSISWDDVVKINAKNEFNIYSGRIVYEIFEEKLDSLPGTGGFCAFIVIVGIVLLIVLRKGFADILTTLDETWDIPKNKRQNAINYRYNQNEYPRLLKVYQEELEAHTKEINAINEERDLACENVRSQARKENDELVEAQRKEKAELNDKINALRSEVGLNGYAVSSLDLYDLIGYIESGDATTSFDAYLMLSDKKHRLEMERREREMQERHERVLAPLHIKAINYSSQVDDSYEREVRRHNVEMERMERERMQMEKDIARKEEREREKAKQQARMDDIRQREQARLKCKGCVNLGKCKTSAMLNSLSCGAYRPK